MIGVCPIFKLPNADNGYYVSDYRAIMADFGTMADFDTMLAEMKTRGLRLVLDLVPNHSSDEHPWFVASRTSRDNPYRDYYVWRPARNAARRPTGARSSADWRGRSTRPRARDHLHIFATKQPDLNWETPQVRRGILYDVMRFWLDKGISGWRIDVVPFISKTLPLADYPANFGGDLGRFHANGPRLHEYLQEMHREYWTGTT